jgi:hypothetical protein
VRNGLRHYLAFYQKVGITLPYFVGLSLVNVAGCTMAVNNHLAFLRRTAVAIDRPNLLLPMAATDVEPESVDTLLKPAFDMIWNACGYFGSSNYDEQGQWRGSAQ